MKEVLRRRAAFCLLAAVYLGVAIALTMSAPALAAEPTDIESNLTIAVGGTEKELALADAMATLNIPSVSLALIDHDRIAWARANGAGPRPTRSFRRRRCRNSWPLWEPCASSMRSALVSMKT
jgi:hypothetical protein